MQIIACVFAQNHNRVLEDENACQLFVPEIIPNTFELTYRTNNDRTGTLFLTYKQPDITSYDDVDDSAPCPAEFSLTIKNHKISAKQPPGDPVDWSKSCYFLRPDVNDYSYTTILPSHDEDQNDDGEPLYEISYDPTDQRYDAIFLRSGTIACEVNEEDTNYQGAKQIQVQGKMFCKYDDTCPFTPPTPDPYVTRSSPVTVLQETQSPRLKPISSKYFPDPSLTLIISTPSIVGMPDLFTHLRCTRNDFIFAKDRQLNAREVTRLSTSIHYQSVQDPSLDDKFTVLHTYRILQLKGQSGLIEQQLSFCTFHADFPGSFNVELFQQHMEQLDVQFILLSHTTTSSTLPSYCFDGVPNFDESDIDCGGAVSLNGCAQCVDETQICNHDSDCASSQCTSHPVWGRRCGLVGSASYMHIHMGLAIIISMITFFTFLM